MQIHHVQAIPVDLPLPRPMEWATDRMTSQAHVLIRIMTDEGVEGNLAAKGGIDVALWDIIGKACGVPCHKLLGGYRENIAPSRILWLTDDASLLDQARDLHEKGYRAFKV